MLYGIIAVVICLILFIVIERVVAKKLNVARGKIRDGHNRLQSYDRFPFNLLFSREINDGYARLRQGEKQYSKGLLIHRLLVVGIFLLLMALIGLIIAFFVI